MFTYTPGKSRVLSAVLLAVSPALSLLLTAVGLGCAGLVRHILFALALLLTATGTTLIVRLQLPVYTYEISDTECPGQYDLCISSRLGKRIKPDCRVRVAGFLYRDSRKNRGKLPIFLCCPLFTPEERYLFVPEEGENTFGIVLCPNAEMRRLMQALGVKVQEEQDKK